MGHEDLDACCVPELRSLDSLENVHDVEKNLKRKIQFDKICINNPLNGFKDMLTF